MDNEILYSGAPPVNIAYQPGSPGLIGSFVTPAHAGFSLNPVAFIKEAVSWVIPYQDILDLGTQLIYLAQGDPRFDASTLALSALGAATIIPMCKPLKVFLKPLKAFMTKFGNKPIIRHLGGFLGKAVKLAASGKTDKVLQVLPFMLIVAEMLEEPEAIMILVDSIQSSEDIWSWISYLSLPADGWDGDEEPELDLGGVYEDQVGMFAGVGIPLVENAYAGKKLPKIKGGKFAKTINNIVESIGDGLIKNGGFSDGLGATAKLLRTADVKTMRKFVTDPKFLVSTVTVNARFGMKNLQNFLTGKTDSRVNPILMIGIVAFLEEQMIYDKNNPPPKKITDEKVKKGINNLLRKSLINTVFGGRKASEESPYKESRIKGTRHGAMFHLAQVAYYQFAYQYLNGTPVKGVDMGRQVYLYKNQNYFDNRNSHGKPYLRYVDIILGESDTSDSTEVSTEEWIELKSLQRKIYSSGKVSLYDFGQWSLKPGSKKGPSKYHKQFFIDRVAASQPGMARTPKNYKVSNLKDKNVTVGNFIWWFQKFKVSVTDKKTGKSETIVSYNSGDIKRIGKAFIKLPITASGSDDMDAIKYSTGSQNITPGFIVLQRDFDSMLFEFGQNNLLPMAEN